MSTILGSEQPMGSDQSRFDMDNALALFAETARSVDQELRESEMLAESAPAKSTSIAVPVRPRKTAFTLSLKRSVKEPGKALCRSVEWRLNRRDFGIAAAVALILLSAAGIAVRASRWKDSSALVEDAVRDMKAGRDDSALSKLNTAIATSGDNVYARFYRAEIYRKAHNYPASCSDYDRLVGQYPFSIKGLHGRAWSRLGAGDYTGAIDDARKLHRFDHQSKEALCIFGEVLNRQHHFAGAIKSLQSYLDMKSASHGTETQHKSVEPEESLDDSPLSFAGNSVLDANQRKLAKRESLTPIDNRLYAPAEDHHEEAFRELGYAYAHQTQPDKAVIAYTQALSLDPNDRTAVMGRARSYLAGNQYYQAMRDCDRAICQGDTSSDPYYLRAISKHFLLLTPEAIDDLSHIIQHEPRAIEARVQRAMCYVDLDQYDKAIDDCRQALALDPSHEQARTTMVLAQRLAARRPSKSNSSNTCFWQTKSKQVH